MGATLIPPGVPVTPFEREQAMLAQRRAALQAAYRAKTGRRLLLERLKAQSSAASHELAADMISDPPELLLRLPVGALLKRIRRLGESGACRMCAAARVDQATSLGELDPEQRAALAAILRMRYRPVAGERS